MKIKLKIVFIIIVILLMTIGISLVSVLLGISENRALQERLHKSRVEIQKNFSQICKEALIGKDDLLVINYARIIKKIHDDVIYAYLITSEHLILSDINDSKLHEQLGNNLTVWKSGSYRIQGTQIYFLSDRIFDGNDQLGVVYVGFDHEVFLKKLMQQKNDYRNRIVIGAGISLSVGLFITMLITNKVFEPIRRLNKGAQMIGQGILSHRISVTSNNELGELAKEFNEMARKLEKLDEMKNNFISSVSHELKTPLSALKVYVDLLQEDPSMFMNEDKRTKTLGIMRKNIDRLSAFISDILDLARIKADKLELHLINAQVAEIIYDIVGFYKPLFEKGNLRFVMRNEALPPLVRIDPLKIRQVITNIIGNALKFTPPGGEIAVAYNVHEPFLIISISDTGPGISQNYLEIIFEQFQKVNANYGPDGGKTKGTGLGLSICKGIIEAHGGKIWAESVTGAGSIFHFMVPLAESPV